MFANLLRNANKHDLKACFIDMDRMEIGKKFTPSLDTRQARHSAQPRPRSPGKVKKDSSSKSTQGALGIKSPQGPKPTITKFVESR